MYNLCIRDGKNKKIVDGNLHFVDKITGNAYVLTKCKVKGILSGISSDKYFVNQYLIPLDEFVKLNGKKIHLNKNGMEFLYAILCYQIDDDFDLSLYRRVDIVRDDNSRKVIDVHYHNDYFMKKLNYVYHENDGNKSHIRDKSTERIKRILNKNKL